MESNSFEKESSANVVDIKHEPLEPDVEDYVSIPVPYRFNAGFFGLNYGLNHSREEKIYKLLQMAA